MFQDVTILFSDVVGFTHICSRIEPMQVVAMLNGMYTKFDQLSEAHEVYKVNIRSLHGSLFVLIVFVFMLGLIEFVGSLLNF